MWRAGACRPRGRQGYLDAVAGGVCAQFVEGADGVFGRGPGGGRDRDARGCDDAAGDAGAAGDAAGVDSEERGGDLGGQAEVVAQAQDDDVAGDVGAAVAVRGRVPGGEVADLDVQPGLLGQGGEAGLPGLVPGPVGAAGVAGDQQPRRPW